MALAKKCDRCGKLYEHYPTGNKMQYNALRTIQRNAAGETVNGNATYDLCPECMSALREFIADRKAQKEADI